MRVMASLCLFPLIGYEDGRSSSAAEAPTCSAGVSVENPSPVTISRGTRQSTFVRVFWVFLSLSCSKHLNQGLTCRENSSRLTQQMKHNNFLFHKRNNSCSFLILKYTVIYSFSWHENNRALVLHFP